MKRAIIKIDEKKCTGCGLCVPGCPEGALQIIDGKARLVADYFCDGLGACIGECPEGAIETEIREAEPYDERKALINIIPKGANVLKAHLAHLYDHGEEELLELALDECNKQGVTIPDYKSPKHHSGCPGHQAAVIDRPSEGSSTSDDATVSAELKNWPIQLKLLNPGAPYLKNAELLFAADCTAFAYANVHRDFIKGKVCIILCPKLDTGVDEYIEKVAAILKNCSIKSLSILRMQVPCCGGLTQIIKLAQEHAGVTVPVTEQIVTIDGNLM